MQRPKVSIPGLKFKKNGVFSHSIASFWGWGWGVKMVSCTVFHSQKFEKITILQNLTTIHRQNKFSDFLLLSGKKWFLEKKIYCEDPFGAKRQ